MNYNLPPGCLWHDLDPQDQDAELEQEIAKGERDYDTQRADEIIALCE